MFGVKEEVFGVSSFFFSCFPINYIHGVSSSCCSAVVLRLIVLIDPVLLTLSYILQTVTSVELFSDLSSLCFLRFGKVQAAKTTRLSSEENYVHGRD